MAAIFQTPKFLELPDIPYSLGMFNHLQKSHLEITMTCYDHQSTIYNRTLHNR